MSEPDHITIILPWPSSDLSPNSRNQWNKIKACEAARISARIDMMNHCPYAKCPPGPLSVRYRFYPPTARWFDDDNLIASMKSARDGIFDFFGTNDHAVVMTSGRRCEVRKGGAVEVTIMQDKGD